MPAHIDAATIAPGGKSSTPNGGAFVGAQQGGRGYAGINGKECRYENETATADNRIDQAGKPGGQQYERGFHVTVKRPSMGRSFNA